MYQYVYSYDGTFTTIDPFILPTWKYLIKLFAKVRFWTNDVNTPTLKYDFQVLLDVDIWDRGLGVAHADELFLIFQPHILPVHSLLTENDRLVSSRWIGLILNFIK